MSRLRRYTPVAAYLIGLTIIGGLHNNGTIASEVPGLLYSSFGLIWLVVYIWRNRSAGDEVGDRNPASTEWLHDVRDPKYFTMGPGSPNFPGR